MSHNDDSYLYYGVGDSTHSNSSSSRHSSDDIDSDRKAAAPSSFGYHHNPERDLKEAAYYHSLNFPGGTPEEHWQAVLKERQAASDAAAEYQKKQKLINELNELNEKKTKKIAMALAGLFVLITLIFISLSIVGFIVAAIAGWIIGMILGSIVNDK